MTQSIWGPLSKIVNVNVCPFDYTAFAVSGKVGIP